MRSYKSNGRGEERGHERRDEKSTSLRVIGGPEGVGCLAGEELVKQVGAMEPL